MQFKALLVMLFIHLLSSGFLCDYSSEDATRNISSTKPQRRMAQRLSQTHTFRLYDFQCGIIDEVFQKSGLSYAMYIKSCSARFIKIYRLFDNNLLVYISMHDWIIDNRLQVYINQIPQKLSFNFSLAYMLIRLDKCPPLDQVSVIVNPPPKNAQNSSIEVKLSDPRNGSGEYPLMEQPLPDILEMQIDEPQFSPSACTLANSYLMLCARNRHSSCAVRVVDQEQKLVECDCGASFIFYIFCFTLLLSLIWLSFYYSFKPSEEQEWRLEEAVSPVPACNPEQAYHYQAIYQLGCPTTKFDPTNTLIEFELLDSKLASIGGQGKYMLTDLTGTKLEHFICNLYLPEPLPPVHGVRVRHTNGFPGSGIFLFNIILTCLRGPKLNTKANAKEDNAIQDKRIKIFAYIQDSTKIYTSLDKDTQPLLPPLTYPSNSGAFLKALVWLCCSQTVYLSILFLDLLYLKLPITILSLCIALAISFILLLQLAILILIHKDIALRSTIFALLSGILPQKPKTDKCKLPPYYWGTFYVDILLWLFLLFSIGAFIMLIIWNHKHSLVRALYIQGIFEIVLVVVFCVSFITYELYKPGWFFFHDRLMAEYQLISDSNLRAQQYSISAGSTSEDQSASLSSSSSGSLKSASSSVKSVEGSSETLSD